MANGVRINNLNQATSLNDTDMITIIQDDENKKASVSLLDKDGTYAQSVVNTILDLITTSKANVETTKQAIDEKFGEDEFSAQINTMQEMSSIGISDDGSVDVSSQVQDGFMETAILYGRTQYHDKNSDIYYDSMPQDTTSMDLELVSVKYTTHEDGSKLPILIATNGQPEFLEDGITPNPDYKTSILTANEVVTLRGIGDVQDTLDCLTGKVTQRIGEIVFDGSETSWETSDIQNQTETMVFQINSDNIKTIPHPREGSLPICDKLPSNNTSTNDTEGVLVCQGTNGHGFYIRIKHSKLSTQDVNGLKTYLQSNPITIQYVLEAPIAKKVDLNSSNGDVKTPVTYKNGHILLQSDGLVPELHYSLPISYSGVIAQNTMTNLKHSWRLDELEIMAYASIVNSQYESLLLVATAETNEITVSTEYVPDEFLYNMLKVLVNASALVNADEKINVFYLYGKLSDEMYIDLMMGDGMQ